MPKTIEQMDDFHTLEKKKTHNSTVQTISEDSLRLFPFQASQYKATISGSSGRLSTPIPDEKAGPSSLGCWFPDRAWQNKKRSPLTRNTNIYLSQDLFRNLRVASNLSLFWFGKFKPKKSTTP